MTITILDAALARGARTKPSLLDMAKKISQPEPGSKESEIRTMREAIAGGDDGLTVPKFLERPATPDAEKRLDMIRAAAKRVRENPGRYIKNPPNRVSEGAKMLGASPAQLRSTGATLKSETTEQEKPMRTKSKTTKAGKSNARKAVTKATKPAKAGESKTEKAVAMLMKGATRKQIGDACNWPSIDLKAIAKRKGLKLSEKDGVYKATAA